MSPSNLINVIKSLHCENTTSIRVCNQTTLDTPTPNGFRQGDSLSSFIFSQIIDEDFLGKEIKLSNKEISTVCYADDAALVTESEYDLERLLHTFYLTAGKYNMVASTDKTKSMTFPWEPVRCKLVVENKPIK